MSSRALNETPWDKRRTEKGIWTRRWVGVLIEYPGISLSPVHPLSLKCHSTVGPIVRPSQRACLQLA